jgi:hypothetical protein
MVPQGPTIIKSGKNTGLNLRRCSRDLQKDHDRMMVMNVIGILTALISLAFLSLREAFAAGSPAVGALSPSRIGITIAPLLTTHPIGNGAWHQIAPERFGFPVERELTLIADDIPGRVHRPTLKVSEGLMSGVLWCNLVSMSIKSLSQTEFSAPSVESTAIDCGSDVIAADDLVTNVLAYCRWHKEGSELVFENEHGRLRFAIRPKR